MTRTAERTLFLACLGRLLVFAERRGIELICSDFDRSDAEQAELRRRGASQARRSRHQDWCAVDLVVIRDGKPVWTHVAGDAYERLGTFWEKQHPRCRWGGRWKTLVDAVHFELSRADGA